jgi:hypothetical protein
MDKHQLVGKQPRELRRIASHQRLQTRLIRRQHGLDRR